MHMNEIRYLEAENSRSKDRPQHYATFCEGDRMTKRKMVKGQRKTPSLQMELAGTDGEKGHKEKLRKYAGAKSHSLSVAAHILQHEPLLYKEAEALQACASWLVFRHYFTVGRYRLIGGCSCKKHLLCAMCALRRAAKTVRAYEAKIRQVMSEQAGAELVPVLITLTVKNGVDLEERTNHLEKSFKTMVSNRRYAKAGGRHKTVFRLIAGAAGAFEFKRGSRSKLWHPHIHLWALIPEGSDLLEMEWNLSDEWRRITKDSHNVDVTPIDCSTDESFLKSICEVFRYALKFGEMEIKDQVHAYKVLKGRRLVRDFGLLHGVQVPDELHDTIEADLALEPYIDLMYQHVGGKVGYALNAVCDTGDMYTGAVKPKTTAGSKAASRLSSRLFVSIPDPDSTGPRKLTLDQNYMNQWVDENPAKNTFTPEEVPF